MEDNLKKFIDDNREVFDNEAPLPEAWQQLKSKLQSQPAAKVKSFRWQWAAAAAVILAIAGVIFYLVPKKHDVETAIINTKDSTSPKPDTAQEPLVKNKIDSVVDKKRNTEIALNKLNSAVGKKLLATTGNSEYSQLLFHYTSLVKEKQQQEGVMKDISPELAVDFKKATDDLDELFLQLQNELPGSVDKQKVMKMMIENLQMQESILKKQLQLINKVQSPANKKDNDAYDNI